MLNLLKNFEFLTISQLFYALKWARKSDYIKIPFKLAKLYNAIVQQGLHNIKVFNKNIGGISISKL